MSFPYTLTEAYDGTRIMVILIPKEIPKNVPWADVKESRRFVQDTLQEKITITHPKHKALLVWDAENGKLGFLPQGNAALRTSLLNLAQELLATHCDGSISSLP